MEGVDGEVKGGVEEWLKKVEEMGGIVVEIDVDMRERYVAS